MRSMFGPALLFVAASAACLAPPLLAAKPQFVAKSPSAAFPLSDVDHPVVIVNLSGQALRVLLNTGVPTTVIDARYRTLLGPAKNRKSTAQAYTVHERPKADIGGIELGLAEIVCVDLGEPVAGEGVDGFLGMDFLKRLCVDFDWDRGTLRLSQTVPELTSGRYRQVALAYDRESVPQVAAKINGKSFQLRIDTGWIGPLTLSPQDEHTAFPKGPAHSVSEFGMTPRGILQSRMTRAADLELAGTHARDVLCSVQLPAQTSTKIGSYFLREHRTVFDFPRDRLLLVRREQAAPAEADMSGIHLLRRRGKTLVYAVDDDSPAGAAGIAAGDQIVAIDEEPATNLTPAQLRELLRSGDGERLALKLVHEGTPRTVDLTLRKRI